MQSQHLHLRLLGTVAGVATALLGASVPVHADVAPPHLPQGIAFANGWYTYANVTHIPNASVALVQGTKTVQGQSFTCAFREKIALPLNASVVQEQDVAFNPDTCTRRVERGVQTNGISSNSVLPASTSTSAGYAYAGEIDPANITVTSDKAMMTWNWHQSGCGASIVSSSEHSGWFIPSGWAETSAGHSPSDQCGVVLNSANAHMENGVFCQGFGLGSYAFSDYNTVQVIGDKNGNVSGYFDYSVSGSLPGGGECVALLHSTQSVGYGNGP